MENEKELWKIILTEAMSMVIFSSLVFKVFMLTDEQQRPKYLTETGALVSCPLLAATQTITKLIITITISLNMIGG